MIEEIDTRPFDKVTFRNWLADELDWRSLRLPADKGYWTFHPPIPAGIDTAIKGYHWLRKDKTPAGEWCIVFRLTQRGPMRARVTAQCRVDAPPVIEFFHKLQAKLEKDFPAERPTTAQRGNREPRRSKGEKHIDTDMKIAEVKRIRNEYIKSGKGIIGRIKACQLAHVNEATVEKHEPELWRNWENSDYS